MTLKDRIPVCPHGKPEDISFDLVAALQRLELHVGHELSYNSGFRCPDCNAKAGGSVHSAHLRGLAVDVSCVQSKERFEILENAIILGWRRIGIGKTFVHLDVDSSLPQEVCWTY